VPEPTTTPEGVTVTATPATVAPKPTETAAAPPWGSAEEFDPDRAWAKIKGLMADKEKLQARETLTDDQKAKLAEYDKLVEASRTDSERRDEELRKLQESTAAIPKLEAEKLRLEVALEKGLTTEQAARLVGADKEALLADADTLLSWAKPAEPANRLPKPNPAQGANSSTSPQGQVSKDELSRMTTEQINTARREGRLDELLGKTS